MVNTKSSRRQRKAKPAREIPSEEVVQDLASLHTSNQPIRQLRRKEDFRLEEVALPASLLHHSVPTEKPRLVFESQGSLDRQMRFTRLFIASLGNPAPHLTTRHSAGHVLIKALQPHLGLPAFTKSKMYGGLTSLGSDVERPEFTLWQSPSLMNISGPALLKAYKLFASLASSAEEETGLVILHDEMETAPGVLKVRRGATSAKGHNGIRSVQQSLQGAVLTGRLEGSFVKVAIGIGRPPGGTRERDDVSNYVLGQLTELEQSRIEGRVGDLEKILEQERARIGAIGS